MKTPTPATAAAEFSLTRPTYDWLLIMVDGTFAVAHGRKSWEKTQPIVKGEVAHYSRLTAKCKAVPVAGGWEIFRGDVFLGGIRIRNDRWETSNPAGEWAPTWGLSSAAKGWTMEYLAVLGAA